MRRLLISKCKFLMAKIIPAINAETFSELEEKIEKIKAVSRIVHIDVADGTYTPNILWHESSDLSKIDSQTELEIHLMMAEADEKIDEWLVSPVKRIIFHVDASRDPKILIEKIKGKGFEAGLALSSGVSWTDAAHYKGIADYFLFLLVSPGKAGQEMDSAGLEEIRAMRGFCGSCIIEVDGGMNKTSIPSAIQAGANIIVSASAVFDSDSPAQALKELREIYG